MEVLNIQHMLNMEINVKLLDQLPPSVVVIYRATNYIFKTFPCLLVNSGQSGVHYHYVFV